MTADMTARVFVLPAAGGGGAAQVIAPDPNRPKRPLPVPGTMRLEDSVIYHMWLMYLARERERASRDCMRCGDRHVCLKPAQLRERRQQRQRCKAARARTRSPYCVPGCPGCGPAPRKRPGLCKTCGHVHECRAYGPVRPAWWAAFEAAVPPFRFAYQKRLWALEQQRLQRLATKARKRAAPRKPATAA